MTLSCIHKVQYLSVECGVVWEFIKYDVLNPSDSIPKREVLRITLMLTKVKPHYQGFSSIPHGNKVHKQMGDINNGQLNKRITPHLKVLVISKVVSKFIIVHNRKIFFPSIIRTQCVQRSQCRCSGPCSCSHLHALRTYKVITMYMDGNLMG